ncbi:MAG: hypothetical protein KTR21_00635 [Rhodobacteraceae bacterium]|nr:hypothetical protein [Paracoccaceae bacterium]
MALNHGEQKEVEVFESDATLDRLTNKEDQDESEKLMARMLYLAHDAIELGDQEPGRLNAEMAAVGRFLRQWVIHTEPKLRRRQERQRANCDR